MTNVSGSAEKVRIRKLLFLAGVSTLQKEGWTVDKIPKFGKSSVRRITKGRDSQIVSIRTTQDQFIAFPRNDTDSAWVTLSEVDAVVAVSVDDSRKFAQVHMIDGDEMRDRFDRTYAARRAAGHTLPLGRGVWLPLYLPDAESPPAQVGGGAGLAHPPIARVPLPPPGARSVTSLDVEGSDEPDDGDDLNVDEPDSDSVPITIGEAKRRLALSLGVDPSSIKITVEA